MEYFWSPDAVGGCLGCLIKVLSDATNNFIYLHYNSMELGPLRAGGGAKRPLLRVLVKRNKVEPCIVMYCELFFRSHFYFSDAPSVAAIFVAYDTYLLDHFSLYVYVEKGKKALFMATLGHVGH